MFELYRPGTSFLHRMPAGWKLLALALAGTGLFLISTLPLLLALLAGAALLYPAAGLSLKAGWAQLRPAFWILLAIFLAQGLLNSWALAVFVVARFAALLMLAGLLTLTTPVSAMIAAMEHGFRPLRHIGASPAKISLALALALRFIPVMAALTREVREAQKVRGLDRSVLAVAVPVVVRMLRMSDDIADAIDARGYNPEL